MMKRACSAAANTACSQHCPLNEGFGTVTKGTKASGIQVDDDVILCPGLQVSDSNCVIAVLMQMRRKLSPFSCT